jgi:hypothetical protein
LEATVKHGYVRALKAKTTAYHGQAGIPVITISSKCIGSSVLNAAPHQQEDKRHTMAAKYSQDATLPSILVHDAQYRQPPLCGIDKKTC